MQDVRYMLQGGSTFPCRDVMEAWLKRDLLRASRVGVHRELGDVDRQPPPPHNIAFYVPAVVGSRPQHRRAAMLHVGEVRLATPEGEHVGSVVDGHNRLRLAPPQVRGGAKA